jgi:4-amino-4-deoxy-L-arabinose transferase-like glycosyltransferase
MSTTNADASSRLYPLRFALPESVRGWLVGGILLLAWRLLSLAWTPGELIPDEAYYWDWSRHLDGGYYSKPPLIAWIIAASTGLLGNHEFAVRLPAVILSTAGLIAVFLLTRLLYSTRAAGMTVLAMAASPGVTASSMFMTIDAPFLCAWGFALWSLWNLLESPPGGWKWVLPEIVATAGGLLAKQTMVGLFPLLALFLMLSSEDRRRWRDSRLHVWCLASLLSLTPVIWWNLQHDWLTWQHTQEHFRATTTSPLQHLAWGSEFLVSQFGVVSPVALTLVLIVMLGGLLRWRPIPRREKFLLVFSIVPLMPVAALSFLQRVQPNWPAAFYVAGFILLGGWVAGDVSVSPRADCWRRYWGAGVVVGAVLSAMLYLLPVSLPATSLAGTKIDPTTRFRGWRALAEAVDAGRRKAPGNLPELVIAATSRGPVSLLAFYLPDQPHVYRWNASGRIDSQHDVWGGPNQSAGASAIIITEGAWPVDGVLADAFASVTPVSEIRIPLGNKRFHEYAVWRGTGFRQWPKSAQIKSPRR